ncbi:MAG: glutamate formimidoyltransferase [Anaerolineae bacterium]|nr:glutamate formimidoyltransferase [Anaerolineae bacterium]
MRQLVECVPNFSEGRRSDVIDRIVAEITAVPQVQLLDRESDADHNRSVVTFVGAPQAVAEAAFRAIRLASQLIDLNTHQGAHPRIGATDVVPFIPIEGVTMADCVALAKHLGQRVGGELGIPVYLYEAAATRPENQNLADVRKGEYEGLKQAVLTDANRRPDYGPSELGTAGATVIGARAPLIAFNVYLTTTDVDIAKKIARAIRHQTGGLRFVKALGLLVDGKAQVSMNLTDYTQTAIFRVVEMVRREAQRYGVGIQSTELIGLIPQQALFDAAQWYLQIDNFTPQQVLENRLTDTGSDSTFLNALASADPTPGGGSAAAYAGAMAAGLVAMVARVTVGKKKYADVEARMLEIIPQAETLRAELDKGVQRDADAFTAVIDAFKLPKDAPERPAAIEEATLNAARIPLNAAETALKVLALAAEVAETGNLNAVSDAGSAGSLAHTAIYAAGLNVKINAKSLTDRAAAAELVGRVAALETEAKAYTERIHAALNGRGGLGGDA